MNTPPDTSWLDTPPTEAPTSPQPHIRASTGLVNEKRRGAPVTMTIAGKGRTWHSDGKYIWFRRKKANPATTQRLNTHIEKGEIKFIVTSDDVEMYEVLPKSPFYRKSAQDLMVIDFQSLKWTAIYAAKKRDWVTFVDALSEMASRIKNRTYSDGGQATGEFARQIYSENLNYLFHLVSASGGPVRAEIDREVQNVQLARGTSRNSAILLPPPSPIIAP